MILINCLEDILADSYALYFKTQNYHWNVEGKTFTSLHLLFESQYEDLAKAIDVIAERIRILGSKVAPLAKILTRSSIIAEHSNASDEEMLKELIQAQKIIIATLYTGLKAAQQAGDEGTMDLIVKSHHTP